MSFQVSSNLVWIAICIAGAPVYFGLAGWVAGLCHHHDTIACTRDLGGEGVRPNLIHSPMCQVAGLLWPITTAVFLVCFLFHLLVIKPFSTFGPKI